MFFQSTRVTRNQTMTNSSTDIFIYLICILVAALAIILFCILFDCCKQGQKDGRKRQLMITQTAFENEDQSEVHSNLINKRRRRSNGHTRRLRELKRALRYGESTPSSHSVSDLEHTGRPKSISGTGSFSVSTSNEKTQETTENNNNNILVNFSPDGKTPLSTEADQIVQQSV